MGDPGEQLEENVTEAVEDLSIIWVAEAVKAFGSSWRTNEMLDAFRYA